jgi:membrane protein
MVARRRNTASQTGAGKPRRTARLATGVSTLVKRVQNLKPMRVLEHYSRCRGALLAAGLAYRSIFAVFAAVWVGFSVVGLLLRSNPALRDSIFSLLGTAVPGLIDTGNGTGAINPQILLDAKILGWTGAIALAGLFFTALGWLASAREAIRTIFTLPNPTTNFFLLKLKDVVLGICFGVAVIISAALSVFSSQAMDAILGLVGIHPHSFISAALTRLVGLVLMFALDTAVLMALYRVLSRVGIPPGRLLVGSLLGAIGLGVLKVLGSVLLGGASSNPLLASFAVIIGLLIWFNLICQVILLGAAWIATGMADLERRENAIAGDDAGRRTRATGPHRARTHSVRARQ